MLLLADVVSQTKHMFNTEEREREREREREKVENDVT